MNKSETFRNDTEFRNNLIKILKKCYEEKLSDFLEYCIYTNTTEPIMETLYILSVNRFDKK